MSAESDRERREQRRTEDNNRRATMRAQREQKAGNK